MTAAAFLTTTSHHVFFRFSPVFVFFSFVGAVR